MLINMEVWINLCKDTKKCIFRIQPEYEQLNVS